MRRPHVCSGVRGKQQMMQSLAGEVNAFRDEPPIDC
jgi:hypothetical protein